MIKFLVKGQNIETLEHEIIAADQIAFVKVHFAFDNSWKPLHKVVQFTQDESTYNRVLGTEETSCFLPSELLAGTVKMSLFGYDAASSETVRATTVVKTLYIRPSGFEGENSNVPPTPDLYQQLLQDTGTDLAANYYDTGYKAYRSGDYETAIENLTKAVSYDETNSEALYALANSYRDNGNKRQAKETYQKVIELFPNTEKATQSQRALDQLDN